MLSSPWARPITERALSASPARFNPMRGQHHALPLRELRLVHLVRLDEGVVRLPDLIGRRLRLQRSQHQHPEPALGEAIVGGEAPRALVAPLLRLGGLVQVDRRLEQPPHGLVGVGQVRVRLVRVARRQLAVRRPPLDDLQVAQDVHRRRLRRVGLDGPDQIGLRRLHRGVRLATRREVEQPLQVAQRPARLQRVGIVRRDGERLRRALQPRVDDRARSSPPALPPRGAPAGTSGSPAARAARPTCRPAPPRRRTRSRRAPSIVIAPGMSPAPSSESPWVTVCFARWNASHAAALRVPALLVSTCTCAPICLRSAADTSATSVSCRANASGLVFSISSVRADRAAGRARPASPRSRAPCRPLCATVPLTIVPTLSALAMLSGAMSFPLNGATPFRDVTCSAFTVPELVDQRLGEPVRQVAAATDPGSGRRSTAPRCRSPSSRRASRRRLPPPPLRARTSPPPASSGTATSAPISSFFFAAAADARRRPPCWPGSPSSAGCSRRRSAAPSLSVSAFGEVGRRAEPVRRHLRHRADDRVLDRVRHRAAHDLQARHVVERVPREQRHRRRAR